MLGELVYWYPGGDVNQSPHPAFVTAVGGDSVNVNIMDPSCYNFRLRDGVRHVDDPKSRKDAAAEAGAWAFSPFGAEMRRVTVALARLEAANNKGK